METRPHFSITDDKVTEKVNKVITGDIMMSFLTIIYKFMSFPSSVLMRTIPGVFALSVTYNQTGSVYLRLVLCYHMLLTLSKLLTG